MDLCIKTLLTSFYGIVELSFNPCFNGSMYKNKMYFQEYLDILNCFNPCFNGSMYKNSAGEPTEVAVALFQSLF